MWDPFEQTLSAFGKQNLLVARIEAVIDLKIPDQSKRFLIDVGLPIEEVLLCKFDLDLPSFPTIEEYAKQQGKKFNSGKLLRRIGWDGGMQICLSEEASSGHVITVDIEKRFRERFVNTSVELFGAFLALYVEEYCKRSYSSDKELDNKAYELNKKLRGLDPSAFSNSDNWWACITQQMKEGML